MNRLRSWAKWLYPGMGVKRWIGLAFVGVLLGITGAALASNLKTIDYVQNLNDLAEAVFRRTGIQLQPIHLVLIGVALLVLSISLVLISIVLFALSVLRAVAPDAEKNLADRIFVRRSLSQGQRIVVLGGGTGLSTMLRGLKEYTSNIVAVVTVTDNGGSSGRLIQQTGMLPPGDLRNCLVALADAEPMLSDLFQYRFEDGHEGLGGHSFGNLFIAAMASLNHGDYEEAITATSKVLAIRGRVFPSTTQNVCLLAEMEDGTIVEGETEIAAHPKGIRRMYLRPENAQPLKAVLRAIREADAIILGPGSVYTSVVPNLLVEGISDAIAKSKAVKAYVCNVMTQPGETDGFTASQHIKAIEEHAGGRKLFSHVLINTQMPDLQVLGRYEKYGQHFVLPDVDTVKQMGYAPVMGNFISHTDVVRHDSTRLADAIFRIIL